MPPAARGIADPAHRTDLNACRDAGGRPRGGGRLRATWRHSSSRWPMPWCGTPCAGRSAHLRRRHARHASRCVPLFSSVDHSPMLPRARSPDTQVRTSYLPCLRRSPFSPTCRYRMTGLIGSEVTRRAAAAQGCMRGRGRRGEGLRARQRNAGELKHGGIDGCSTTLGLVCLPGRPGAALCQRTPFFCI